MATDADKKTRKVGAMKCNRIEGSVSAPRPDACGPHTDATVSPKSTRKAPRCCSGLMVSAVETRPDAAMQSEKTIVRPVNGDMSERGISPKAIRSSTVAFTSKQTKPTSHR
jgi:hypothetical protein